MVSDDVIKTSLPFYNEVQLTDLRLEYFNGRRSI
jgi:hypothetical protein